MTPQIRSNSIHRKSLKTMGFDPGGLVEVLGTVAPNFPYFKEKNKEVRFPPSFGLSHLEPQTL
jgi:hypothetical protein